MAEGKRLNILFLVSWYPTRENPYLGVFVREHAKAAALYANIRILRCPHPVTGLGSLWQLEEETDDSITAGIRTYRLLCRQVPFLKAGYLTYIWSALQAVRRLRQMGFRPDLIHAHVYEAGILALVIGRVFRMPVVITEHSTEFPRRILQRFDRWKARIAFRWCDRVLPVSERLQAAITDYGMKATFQVVPNVVDVDLFRPDVGRPPNDACTRLLFVGLLDLSHKKGIPNLLQALARLRAPIASWHADIVGDGPARAAYESLAAELGLGSNVSFHGSKNRAEVADFMRRADLFVLPSVFETFSVVVAEALASGLPVVVTECGGPEEFVTPDVGQVVPNNDVAAIAGAIDEFMNRRHEYNPQALAAYARARFGPAQVGKMLDGIYRELLGDSAGRLQAGSPASGVARGEQGSLSTTGRQEES